MYAPRKRPLAVTSISPQTNGFISSTDKKNADSEAVLPHSDDLLNQREADLSVFNLQTQQVDALIKMVGKVTESLLGKSEWRDGVRQEHCSVTAVRNGGP